MTSANRRALWAARRNERDGGPRSHSSALALARADAEADLDALAKAIERDFSYAELSGFSFRAALDALRAGLGERIGVQTFAFQLVTFLSSFGDGHARLEGFPDHYSLRGYPPFLVDDCGERLAAFRADRTAWIVVEHPYITHLDGLPVESWLADASAAPRHSLIEVYRASSEAARPAAFAASGGEPGERGWAFEAHGAPCHLRHEANLWRMASPRERAPEGWDWLSADRTHGVGARAARRRRSVDVTVPREPRPRDRCAREWRRVARRAAAALSLLHGTGEAARDCECFRSAGPTTLLFGVRRRARLPIALFFPSFPPVGRKRSVRRSKHSPRASLHNGSCRLRSSPPALFGPLAVEQSEDIPLYESNRHSP